MARQNGMNDSDGVSNSSKLSEEQAKNNKKDRFPIFVVLILILGGILLIYANNWLQEQSKQREIPIRDKCYQEASDNAFKEVAINQDTGFLLLPEEINWTKQREIKDILYRECLSKNGLDY